MIVNDQKNSYLPPKLEYYRTLPERRFFLPSGSVLVCMEPSAIITVLGSCVSVCLYDPVSRVGGMNHFLMPNAPEGQERSSRYGDSAITLLIEQMIQGGARRSRLVAGVFGGGSVVPELRSGVRIGAQNAQLAIKRLNDEKIAVQKTDLEGLRSRKVIFRTDIGSMQVQTHGEEK